MSYSLIDVALFKSIKFIIKDPEMYSLFCDYLYSALAFRKNFILPTSLKQARRLNQAKDQLETNREILDVTLRLHPDLKSHRSFILQLENLPVSELERLLEIFDGKQ